MGWGGRMELDDRALPPTRGQLDIWLAQETGHSGSCARHPVQEAQEITSSIQRTPMSLAGPLFRFGLFRTRPDEFHLFVCCHHIVIDASGVALVGHRIASVYSAIVCGKPISPEFFGLLPDLVGCGLDQAHWTRNLHSENGPDYRLPQAVGERDPCWPSAPLQLDRSVVGQIKELSKVTQRRQLANVFRDNERAPASLINETVHLIETVVLSMSMQRPIISRTQLPGRLRRVYSHGQLTLHRIHRPIGIGVITTSNTRHSDRAANGRRRLGSTRRSQQANRIRTRLRNRRMRRG